MVLSAATASALVSTFFNIAFTASEEMAKEMRSFGANILLVPKSDPLEIEIGGLRFVSPAESAYLEEADLPSLKTIFWRHNIVAFAPLLSRAVEVENSQALLVGTWFEKEIAVPEAKRVFSFPTGSKREAAPEKGTFRTGLKGLAPWWRVEGRWPREDDDGVLIGSALAGRLKIGAGDRVRVSYEGRSAFFPVRGVAESGGEEEEQIFVPLHVAQKLFALPGKVDKVRLSALVTQDNALAARASRIGPANLPAEEYETWYCTPYLSSIIYQIEEAIPSAKGKAIRQVSEAERDFLTKTRLTFALVVTIALLVALLGVGATVVTSIFERRQEIGLMKALGADARQIRLLFFLEAGAAGLGGGIIGYWGGLALARFIAAGTFGITALRIPFSLQSVILLLTLLLAISVTVLGALFPVRQAARWEAVKTLRGD